MATKRAGKNLTKVSKKDLANAADDGIKEFCLTINIDLQ